MPRKIKALIKDLTKAGFCQVTGGKGSHRKFIHGSVEGFALISGKKGDDAKPYQEKHIKEKIKESKKLK
jgi:predicted RNA binding protein YcfA (HicA-like mRNA interferase family)